VPLGAPVDVIVVRKLGAPFRRGLAMGAVGEGGVRVLDDEVVRAGGVREDEVRAVEVLEREELDRRARRHREDAPGIGAAGRTAVVVDDGMATGSTARATVIMVAPVASGHAVARLRDVGDADVVLDRPEPFYAVGQWCDRFDQTSDAGVVAILPRARARTAGRLPQAPADARDRRAARS
jgi:putative phosphoribosyl transferase